MKDNVFETVAGRLRDGKKQRFIALTNNGSGGLPLCYYWFDLFAKAVYRNFGAKHQFLNTDYYKNTSTLLEGYERDGADFRADVALVLIGGTEMSVSDNAQMPRELTAANLRQIHRRLLDDGVLTVFMTYYAPDPERVDKGFMDHFYGSMDLVREAAAETGAGLIDHLHRWELLRRNHPLIYQSMMQDSLHANHRGNMLMALDMARYFDVAVPSGLSSGIDDGLAIQQLADRLDK